MCSNSLTCSYSVKPAASADRNTLSHVPAKIDNCSAIPLCLSRACLGKTIAFIHNGSNKQKCRFLLCINEPKTVVLHPTLNIIREHRSQLDGAGRPACRPRVSCFSTSSHVCPEPVLVNIRGVSYFTVKRPVKWPVKRQKI